MPQTFLKLLTDFVLPIVIAIVGSSWFSSMITAKKLKSDEILESISALDYKVDLVKVENNRARILRFAGEIRRGIHHDLEEFNDVLGCVDSYENFCKKHPEYPNSKCVSAIELVKSTYQVAYKKNDF